MIPEAPRQGFRLTQGTCQHRASTVPGEEPLDSKRKSWSGNTLELAPVGGRGRLGSFDQQGTRVETSRLCVMGGAAFGAACWVCHAVDVSQFSTVKVA